MANKKLFQDKMRHEPKVDAVNPAGGTAYKKSNEIALAQLATTGTFADTFYEKGEKQIEHMLELADKVSAEFLAKLAVYARNMGKMKDMPAYLVTFLLVKAKKDDTYAPFAEAAFKGVVRNGRIIRNIVLFMRSGTVLGNKSLGSRTQRLINGVMNAASDRQIINWSVGNDPSLSDVIKLSRPNPNKVDTSKSLGAERRGLYSWVIGKDLNPENSAHPKLLNELLTFQKDPVNNPVPNVEFRLLTGVDMPKEKWVDIAQNASYMQTRMNLATFHRHGVFDNKAITKVIKDRLRDKESIRQSGVFPYQQWVAAKKLRGIAGFPSSVSDAMEDAVDLSLDNIPDLVGEVVVAVDVSGSMASPVTGFGSGQATSVRCVDVAALVAAGVKRKHPDARIIAFDTEAREITMSHRDSVVTLSKKLSDYCGGGTNCGAALQLINHWVGAGSWKAPDLLIMVSDNMSWHMHSYGGGFWGNQKPATPALEAWTSIYARNKKAKFICLDIQPSRDQQVPDAVNRTTMGGFSDETFQMFKDIQDGVRGEDVWLERINATQLEL